MRFLVYFIAACVMVLAPASASLLTIHDGAGHIGVLDTESGAATVRATTTVFTDIAFAPDGALYAVDFENLYAVNPLTGATTLIGSHGTANANALVFGSDGVLYAHGAGTTKLFSLNLSTGAGTVIGDTGFSSAGDLAFFNGVLYLSTASGDLAAIDPSTGAGALVGEIGFKNVFGLATDPATNTLFGLTDLTLLAINAATGEGTALFSFSGQGFTDIFGTSFFGEASESPVPGGLVLIATALLGLAACRRGGIGSAWKRARR